MKSPREVRRRRLPSPDPCSYPAPPPTLRVGQGRRGEQFYGVGAFYPQPHGGEVGPGQGHQALDQAAALAGNFQINAGVEVFVAHAAPHGHGHVPLRRVVADEVGDHGLQAGVGVGAGEREAQVEASDLTPTPCIPLPLSEAERGRGIQGG